MKSDNGGPAFPHNEKHDDGTHYLTYHGMTLRDYFAAQVLSSIYTGVCPGDTEAAYIRQHGSKYIYAIADAMLKERSK